MPKASANKKASSRGTKRGSAASGRGSRPHRAAQTAGHANSQGRRKWSAKVTTESTFPEGGLFKEDAATIARRLASKKVSPKGPASGMRMLTFYVNRAGKNLPKSRLRVLERAKALLHARVEAARGS